MEGEEVPGVDGDVTAGRGRVWWWKRPFDLILAAILFLPFVGLGAAVAVLVWARLGRPILFVQVRPGLDGRPFRLVKFRTMSNVVDSPGSDSDADRLTPFGRWLRSTSLDELPELWNVIRGEMSFVGPRPLLMDYLALYDANQSRRMQVLPGITGWAQVHGRNEVSWPERFAYDLWYVEHATLWVDLKILAKTLGQFLKGPGLGRPGPDMMERFRGNA